MDKAMIEEIVSKLIEQLISAPDGYSITTAQLVRQSGYPLNDYEALYEIHFRLFEEAEKAGMNLDMSSHDNKLEGLPYNLAFILRKG